MIVRMAKIEIIGPRQDLMAVLTMVREMGIFQLEPDAAGFIANGDAQRIRSLLFDDKTLGERMLLEDLRKRLDELLTLLPDIKLRTSWIDPSRALETIAESLKRHLPECRDNFQTRQSYARQLVELDHYRQVLRRIAPLLDKVEHDTNLDFAGFSLRDEAGAELLTRILLPVTGGRVEIVTERIEDGSLIALAAIPRSLSARVREELRRVNFPELGLPEEIAELPFPRKLQEIDSRMAELERQISETDFKLTEFARRWGSIYARVQDWLHDRLMLLAATAAVHQTGMCFFIHGWMPAADVVLLHDRLAAQFGSRVVMEEKALQEQELERVPVSIRNHPFLRPFEIITRLLPLPRYGSYDPTPFLGVFFPLFFGMMLGDAGHGLVILLIALFVPHLWPANDTLRQAAAIFRISSLYTMLFGIFYGEFFGEGVAHLPGMETVLLIDRRTAIMPMLYFALSVGVMHVTLALALGAHGSFRKGSVREAIFKLANIVLILAGTVAIASLPGHGQRSILQPALMTVGLAVPLIIVTGGLMAPLEMVKNIGNVISYARLMAIGLSSVFIAHAANTLAGRTGDIVSGMIVGALLHIITIILGLFSPTIHALRLHYVEFFSKFLEEGGRKFEPFRR